MIRTRLFFIILILNFASSMASDIPVSEPLTADEAKRVRAGEIILRELPSSEGEGLTYEVIGEMMTTSEELVDLLIDYEAYPLFMSSVDRIEHVSQTGNQSILNFFLALPMGLERKYRVRIGPSLPEPKTTLIQWHMIEWPELTPGETIGDTRGYWRIEELAPSRLLVTYHVYSDPGKIPFGLEWLVNPLSEKSVVQVFMETRNWIESLDSKNR